MINNCSENVIYISGLSKTFYGQSTNPIEAIQEINLEVSGSEIVCILGPSGCGKSTLLNLIAGLIEPTGGEIAVCGRTAKVGRPEITYVQQDPQLLSYRTVLANAAIGLELRGALNKNSLKKVHKLLKFLKLEEFLFNYPAELSGGMKQRVALARTLSIDAPLILCDEPLASVDFDSRIEIEDFFWTTSKAEQRSSIFVTHSIDSAVALADRVVILSPRPAKVLTIIKIDDIFRQEPPLKRRESSAFAQYFSNIWNPLRIATGVSS